MLSHRWISFQLRAQSLGRVRLFAAPWTVACQALLPMEFSRQEYWSWVPFPNPGDLSHPGIEHACLVSSAWSGGFFTTSTAWEAPFKVGPTKRCLLAFPVLIHDTGRVCLKTLCKNPDSIKITFCLQTLSRFSFRDKPYTAPGHRQANVRGQIKLMKP